MSPVVSRLTKYPVKSLDGLNVDSLSAGEGSFIVGDRQFALMDDRGKLINGKREALVHRLRFSVQGKECFISAEGTGTSVLFDPAGAFREAEVFLSDFFNRHVRILEDPKGNFLDVPVDSALTLVSSSSLRKVAEWLQIDDLEEVRRRFRPNVEVDGVEAFWEDCLFGSPGEVVPFRIGELILECVGPRERCVVPTRNSFTGEGNSSIPKKFAELRWSAVPAGSKLHEWQHGYFLCVDCRISPSSYGGTIRIGDTLSTRP